MQVPVLIVGGGPIGLAASILLSQHGVASLLVNARETTSTHPRARFLDVRTSEILHQMEIYNEVAATGLPSEWLDSVRYSTRFTEPEVLRLPTASYDTTLRDISPLAPIMTAQDLVEPIMADAARSYATGDLRFGHELVDLDVGSDGVKATVRKLSDGTNLTVDALWVIGADGRASTVRALAACGLSEGVSGSSTIQDVLYHGDMSRWVGDRKGALLFVYHPMGYGLFQPLNGTNRWRAQCTTFVPAVPEGEITESLCVDWIRSAIGDEGRECEIDVLGIAPWRPEERLADRFRSGRILLAGGAAHTIFPTGGYGMNLGYHGIHNLIWKLVAVIEGRASEAILDTYEQERRPQVQRTLETATENARRAGAMYRAFLGGGDREGARERLLQYGNFDGMILGPEYHSPLCAIEEEEPPALQNSIRDFEPAVRCGRRAPHEKDTSTGRSVLDCFGRGYVILTPTGSDLAVSHPHVRVERCSLGGVYSSNELVLVRPDGIVAGRWSTDVPSDQVAAGVERLVFAG